MHDLGTVPAGVGLVPGGLTDGASVPAEDRTQDLPVVVSERVGPEHPGGLSVLLAEAAVVCRSAAAAAAAGAHGVFRVPPRLGPGLDLRFLLHLWLPGASQVFLLLLLLTPAAELFQQPAQVHVVVPHIEAVRGLDLHFSSCGHFWNKNCAEFAPERVRVFIGATK